MAEKAKSAPSKKARKVKTKSEAESVPVPMKDDDVPSQEKKGRTGSRNMYHYVGELWKHPSSGEMKAVMWQRLIDWRKEGSFVRVERPTRLDRARSLGYKAKQGVVIVRARVRKGGLRKHSIRKGRRPKRMGISKITMKKNIQRIAEERTAKRYPNLEVLASYWVGEDGKNKWYEVILLDPNHPVIRSDPKLNWIASGKHYHRAERGLTPAGKRGRGLVRTRGRGAEKVRPSARAHNRKGS